MEGGGARLPEEKIRQMFPGKSGDIASDNFDPAYFLLENHYGEQNGFIKFNEAALLM